MLFFLIKITKRRQIKGKQEKQKENRKKEQTSFVPKRFWVASLGI